MSGTVPAAIQDDPVASRILARLRVLLDRLEGVTVKVSRSQVAFRRKKNFALVWVPGMYLHRDAAPLVLTVLGRKRIRSARWKEVVEPAPGRFTHHLELYRVKDVDAQVAQWLQQAWEDAG